MLSLSEILIYLGLIIITSGIIVILIGKFNLNKTIIQDNSFKGIYQNNPILFAQAVIPSPSILNIKAIWEDITIKKITFTITAIAMKPGGGAGMNYKNTFFNYKKICKRNKDYKIKLDPDYGHDIRFEIEKNETEVNIQYQVYKEERPYEWIMPIGLTLLTIGTVLFTAGLKT